MIKYFYVILLIFLTGCHPYSYFRVCNNSTQNTNIKWRNLCSQTLRYEFDAPPLSIDGTSYFYTIDYALEISLDSEKKAYCYIKMKTPFTIYIYDNGFIFSTYNHFVSGDLIKKYKVNMVNGKKNLMFDDLYKDQVFFYPFNTSSPFSPIYLYDKNPPFLPCLGK